MNVRQSRLHTDMGRLTALTGRLLAVRGLAAAFMLLVCGAALAAPGDPAAPPQGSATTVAAPAPAGVQELTRLLADPAVREWLAKQPTAATAPAKPSESAAAEAEAEEPSAGQQAAQRMDQVRAHVARLLAAVPLLGPELNRASVLIKSEINDRRPLGILLLVAGFLALGAGVEWLARRQFAGARTHIAVLPMLSPWQRARGLATRLGFDLAMVMVFALGSIAAFLIFVWPPILKQIVLHILFAAVIFRLVLAVCAFALAPPSEGPGAIRLVPMSDLATSFWLRRIGLFAGWFVFGWAIVNVLVPLGFTTPSRAIVAYVLGLGLLAIGLEAIWRRPRPSALEAGLSGRAETLVERSASPAQTRAPSADAAQADVPSPARAKGAGGRLVINLLLSLYGVLLWGLWVGGLSGLFWLAALALLLPKAIALVGDITDAVFAPPPEAVRPATSATTMDASPEDAPDIEAEIEADPDAEPELAAPPRPVAAIYIERGLRALLVAAAAVFLAQKWNVDLVALTDRDNLVTRLIRGALSSVVILLVADLLWQLIKSLIDRKLAESQASSDLEDAERARRAKLRTLLPIFRNIIFVVLFAMAALTVLAALGVEIGPLIAGAGVVGVAVGFGAQTIVKDIISGMFYLFDDAFRVGEYIVCGKYKGTVESFSLRSIKLRHHRGPIYTVPFGQLGAVENLSRDWVIDKMSVGVTYDTDLAKAKKIIKTIGQELAANPEFAPHIIETLKMQGIDAFGDFAIKLQMKMMTKPGEQFMIRRRAYAMIHEQFDKNGIKFAFPTVQVAGGSETHAAAQNMLDVTAPPAVAVDA